MTRGYACVVNGIQLEKVAYLQSDAYLSYYGVQIMEAVMNCTLDAWFEKQIKYNHELYGQDEPNPDFDLSFIRKTRECPTGQAEYGYLYSRKTGELRVYNNGRLMISVPREQREKYLYFFRNESKIWYALTYDQEKLDFLKKINWNTLVENASIKDLENWKEEGEKPFMILENRHLIAAGYSDRYPVYEKQLRWVNGNAPGFVEFFADKNTYDSFWSAVIQLPYCRISLGERFQTEATVVRFIRNLCKENASQIRRFADVFSMYKEFVKIPENMDIQKINEFVENLKEEYAKSPWYTANGYMSTDRIGKSLKERYYAVPARKAKEA